MSPQEARKRNSSNIADADGDGHVNTTEVAAAAEEAAKKKSEEKAESVFEAIDKNEDGKLTQEARDHASHDCVTI